MGFVGKIKKVVKKSGWAIPGMLPHYAADRTRRHFEKNTRLGKTIKGVYSSLWFNNLPSNNNVAVNSAASYGVHGPTGSIVGRY